MSERPAPLRIGILHDRPAPDGGAGFERLLSLGADEVAAARGFDRSFEYVHASGLGLPAGTADAVERAFASLVEQGVLAVLGPAISDNGIAVRPLVDAARVPCINYTGGEETRSEWMFHYQIGSLEEEPTVLARQLAAQGVATAAVVHDRSPIGRRYAEYFDEASASAGIDLVGRAPIAPLVSDLSGVAKRLLGAAPEALVYLGLGLSAHPLGEALRAAGSRVPVFANSALMFGYLNPEWTALWEGWTYVDGVADDNRLLATLRERIGAGGAAPPGPGAAGAYDMGRLVAEGIGRAVTLTRAGVRDGLERVKMIPAALGREGTTMSFGRFERAALKGEYLVLRQWRGGRSVELDPR